MPTRPVPAESVLVRILVVDDFEPARRSLCSILSTQEQLHVVGEAADGLAAVQRAQELQPEVILLDIGLPGLNGIEASSEIRKVAPKSKILFVSQFNDGDIVRAALSDGQMGYVLKADTGRELLPAIRAVLRGEKFVSSGLKVADPA
jgi:DNA-binding NarL/FixJ family response regulator